jgi:replicative DNA helicase Mcm
MDTTEQINIFREFVEKEYYSELLENVNKENFFLVCDFMKLSKFNPELADAVLEYPEETLKAFELAIKGFDLGINIKSFRVRFYNLPESQQILIRNIRSKHIGILLAMEGIVRQKSDVRPQVTSARFECPSCGAIHNVIQLDTKFKQPSRCSCGWKGKFKLLAKELADVQGIVLEENPEKLEGGEQPKRINIILKEDLVSPLSDKQTNPGTKIMVTGIVKEVPIQLQQGGQSTRFDLFVEANYVAALEEDFGEIKISDEEKEIIEDIGKSKDYLKKLVNSVAPNIYGYEKIKEALLYQMMGGVRKDRAATGITRGDIHVLLIGDPGAAKSQLLKRMSKVAPKARFVSGKGASGAGLTAAVVKDEFLKGWSLEAGALVLANKGMVMIDEFDKMSHEDRSAMHEALEGQTVTISKANIQATLRAETTVLAAANPKFGRFDPYELIAKQIDLPPTLINRFDLIFAIQDKADKERDDKIATFILYQQKDGTAEPEIDTKLLRKYIAYAKQNYKPQLTDEALEEIKAYYLKMRSQGSEDGEVKSIPISARQLEALVRLSEASARCRLSNTVTRQDAKNAIDLLHYSLSQVGVDPETGKFDVDRITTGITATERSKIGNVREIIVELEKIHGKIIPMKEIIKLGVERGLSEDKIEETIEKLKRTGDLYEPKRDYISRI